MKVVAATIVIFIALIGFGAFAYYYIADTSNHLAANVAAIEDNARAKQWRQAEINFNSLQARWNRTGSIWTVLLDHQELDNINIALSRLKQLMETRDVPGFRSELAELEMLLKHIPEKEALNLKNIL